MILLVPLSITASIIAALIIAVISAVTAFLLAPKSNPESSEPDPAKLEDFTAPTIDETRPVNEVFGTCKVTPALIALGDMRAEKIRRRM